MLLVCRETHLGIQLGSCSSGFSLEKRNIFHGAVASQGAARGDAPERWLQGMCGAAGAKGLCWARVTAPGGFGEGLADALLPLPWAQPPGGSVGWPGGDAQARFKPTLLLH